MKKSSIYIVAFALFVFGITSCGKSTKGKMANEWKVTSFEDQAEFWNANSYHIVYQTSMTENSVTQTTNDTPFGGTTVTDSRTGTVNKNEFTIKKNGTWSWTRDMTFTSGASGDNYLLELTGSWSFLGKTKGDEFKKNERVVFHVESQKTKTVQTQNQVVVNTVEEQATYSTGQNTQIYTIKESKRNKLELEMESSHVYTDETNHNKEAHSQKLILETK